MSDLVKELEAVLNRYSVENESDTPDFLLATLLSETLATWAKVTKARDSWYGFKPWGTSSGVTEESPPKNNE